MIEVSASDFAEQELLGYPDKGDPATVLNAAVQKEYLMQSLKLAHTSVLAATLAACLGAVFNSVEATVIDVNDKNFKSEVLNSKLPVFVDFYAVWCGPCKRIAPSVDALATEYEGKVKFVRVDVDQSPVTSAKYDVRFMPIMRIFSGELKEPAELKNYQPKEKIKEFIDSTLSGINAAK